MDMQKGFIIVPKVVAYDWELNDKQKLLYGEIASLTAASWECFASNNYFAERFKCSKGTISKNVSALEKAKYISISLFYKKGTKEVEKRIITTTPSSDELITRGCSEKWFAPIVENVKDNNKEIIIKTNSFSNEKAEEIYNYYIASIKRVGKYETKYNKRALSLERIKAVAKSKKLDTEGLKSLVSAYIKENREQIKGGYGKMCQYFFGPVERGSKVGYYEDYIQTQSAEKKEKKENKENVDIGF